MGITRRASIRLVIAGVTLIATGRFAMAGKINTNGSDFAIEGYDPVAYFSEAKPVEGSSAFTATHDGATWRFSSAANRDLFLADPEKYAPQYGGFCAYAVALGKKFDGDPRYADIVGGKLYLFVNAEIFAKYKKDSKRMLAKAEATWPSIQHKAVKDL